MTEQLPHLYLGDELSPWVSGLLLLDFHACHVAYAVELGDLVEGVRSLEPGGGKSLTRVAAPFEKLPLRGLLHKHFM